MLSTIRNRFFNDKKSEYVSVPTTEMSQSEDVKDGWGIQYYTSDGKKWRYEGEFKNGVHHGKGIRTRCCNERKEVRGTFENGGFKIGTEHSFTYLDMNGGGTIISKDIVDGQIIQTNNAIFNGKYLIDTLLPIEGTIQFYRSSDEVKFVTHGNCIENGKYSDLYWTGVVKQGDKTIYKIDNTPYGFYSTKVSTYRISNNITSYNLGCYIQDFISGKPYPTLLNFPFTSKFNMLKTKLSKYTSDEELERIAFKNTEEFDGELL